MMDSAKTSRATFDMNNIHINDNQNNITTNDNDDSIDWGRTDTFSDIKYIENNDNNNNNDNDIESKWSIMDSDEELEESNFNWCICMTRSFALVLLVIIAVLMSLHKFFPRIYWLAGFVTAFLICIILASFLPLTCLKRHVISTYSISSGIKEIVLGSNINRNTNTNTPTHTNTNSDISTINNSTTTSTLKTKLLPPIK